ncbi:hypothetical protein GWK48_10140 [Metallosphaera tengchongensis]|uniref:Uncharacterized protein n=1 Tax=Metallosphaera tengchongensis TaxID=1532350 RepID=A0A6N0P092_9CREN|nr:hypothetical protein [Metallosphaera tengchongensis]QKR00700.1 hypothetical protein GWK48_10140 [Metallosphaera tengchongensis]
MGLPDFFVAILPTSTGIWMRKFVDTRLYNEVNYERRRFFQQKGADSKGTWDKYYEEYQGDWS